jgi:hypothetical protein
MPRLRIISSEAVVYLAMPQAAIETPISERVYVDVISAFKVGAK